MERGRTTFLSPKYEGKKASPGVLLALSFKFSTDVRYREIEFFGKSFFPHLCQFEDEAIVFMDKIHMSLAVEERIEKKYTTGMEI